MSNREYRVWLDEPTAWDTPGFYVVTEDDVGEDDPELRQVVQYFGEQPGNLSDETAEVWVASEDSRDGAAWFTLDVDITIDVSTYENDRLVFS